MIIEKNSKKGMEGKVRNVEKRKGRKRRLLPKEFFFVSFQYVIMTPIWHPPWLSL